MTGYRKGTNLSIPIPSAVATPELYHHGGPAKPRTTPAHKREFIAWDGEGINLDGEGRPQAYVLFGSNLGCITSKTGLSTFECLDYIIETGRANPHAFHVGFAFTYDSNMIVKSLSPASLARLHKDGWVRLNRKDGTRYNITFAPGKFLRVTRLKPTYDRKSNPTAKTTVCIFDIFSFFACSFIKAYTDLVGPVPDIIKTGKAARGTFSLATFDEMEQYWSVEIQMLKELATELRKRVYNAGLRITSWHGPGALATYAMRQHGIKHHMQEQPEHIRKAARYGYAGGRFELYKVGRVQETVYSYDINSAYPHAITKLPSLVGCEWRYVTGPLRQLNEFGIYHLRLRRGISFVRDISPLFHRDRQHNISFPWYTEGWYWAPEAYNAIKAGAEVVEGWELIPASLERPFAYIADMYKTRKEWQRDGISAQLALKLCMNSTYGKLAQRVGWDEVKQKMPPFHQLEWAGWVTSYVRARLFRAMSRVPFDRLIAVETDGFYCTMSPEEIGIEDSEELGKWEVSEYSEILYVQSGLAWLFDPRKGKWVDKRRGLDAGTFGLDACQDYLRSLQPMPTKDDPWSPYVGQTTRFIGLGHALASSQPTQMRHCVWETQPREIQTGHHGKRVHISSQCRACAEGANAYDMAHDLVIRSLSLLEPHSYPHSIPWEQEDGHADWQDYAELEKYDVTSQYV